MGDRSTSCTSSSGRGRSSRKCTRKRKNSKLPQEPEDQPSSAKKHQQVSCAGGESSSSSRRQPQLDPCNPLGYLPGRQIDDRVDWCRRLLDNRLAHSQNFFRKDLYSHFGCINAIEFSSQGDLLVSGE